jgi:Ca2+-binding EF-hand superfamily protein
MSLLEKKVKTLFVRFDQNGSGTIEIEDFDQWSEKLVALGNLDAEKSAHLREKIKLLWSAYFAPADRDGDGKIDVDELNEHIKKSLNDESKKQALKETLPLIFDAIDVNKVIFLKDIHLKII